MKFNEMDTLRRAAIDDTSACALIVDDWIEKTEEIPPFLTNNSLLK